MATLISALVSTDMLCLCITDFKNIPPGQRYGRGFCDGHSARIHIFPLRCAMITQFVAIVGLCTFM